MKKIRRKEEWKREEGFCGGCGEFAGCGFKPWKNGFYGGVLHVDSGFVTGGDRRW
jgi:hypothetical protein